MGDYWVLKWKEVFFLYLSRFLAFAALNILECLVSISVFYSHYH